MRSVADSPCVSGDPPSRVRRDCLGHCVRTKLTEPLRRLLQRLVSSFEHREFDEPAPLRHDERVGLNGRDKCVDIQVEMPSDPPKRYFTRKLHSSIASSLLRIAAR